MNLPCKIGFTAFCFDIAPQHHIAAIAIVRGAGIDGGAAGHAHRCGCGRGLCSGLQQRVSAALPVAPHQHRAAAGRPRGADAAAALQLNAVALQADAAACASGLGAAGIQGAHILHTRAARQHDASALLLKASGFHRAMTKPPGACTAKRLSTRA